MLIILASAFLLRKLQYEAFHIIHILMSALILVMVGMHRRDITKKTLVLSSSQHRSGSQIEACDSSNWQSTELKTLPQLHRFPMVALASCFARPHLEQFPAHIVSYGFQAFDQQSPIPLLSFPRTLSRWSSLLMMDSLVICMNVL
jgi:hypothetical protein